VNVSSSLERHYARSTFLVAGVGVLATHCGRGLDTDEFSEAAIGGSNGTMSFAATLVALSPEEGPDFDRGLRQERSLAGVA
jgi:hypothetical protein